MIAAWALLIALTLWWWLARGEQAFLDDVMGPPPDPHGAEVATFRRAVHDWDRGRGPEA